MASDSLLLVGFQLEITLILFFIAWLSSWFNYLNDALKCNFY